jgi:hypothetical protein
MVELTGRGGRTPPAAGPARLIGLFHHECRERVDLRFFELRRRLKPPKEASEAAFVKAGERNAAHPARGVVRVKAWKHRRFVSVLGSVRPDGAALTTAMLSRQASDLAHIGRETPWWGSRST